MKETSPVALLSVSAISIAIMLMIQVMLAGAVPADADVPIVDAVTGTCPGPDGMPSRISSMNGDHPADEISNLRIFGSDVDGLKGQLGSYVGHADVNDDGVQDLIASAPDLDGHTGASCAGICYIWFGGPDLPTGDYDLQTSSPNITIRAGSQDTRLLSSFAMGDLDGNGHKDMVLGISTQPEAGKVYVLWNDGVEWPAEIELYAAEGDEPNGNPFGFLRTSANLIISGYVTTSVLAPYRLGDTVLVEDFDGDDLMDLLFTCPGWKNITIVWGKGDRMQLGNEFTVIVDYNYKSSFSDQTALGDVNGNGEIDLVVGNPLHKDVTRDLDEVGSVSVLFDVGSVRGSDVVDYRDIVRPLILGEEMYDRFGSTVILMDLDKDGKDDIIVGAPGEDGPSDQRPNSGQLMVFLGGEELDFPDQMICTEGYDKVIYGDLGSNADYNGDQTGSRLDIGDVDGDGDMELAIPLMSKSYDMNEMSGMLKLYESDDVLMSPLRTVDLRSVTPRLVLGGCTEKDILGYALTMTDLTGDGAEELIVSAPSADGPMESRTQCGEVYVLLGSDLEIDLLRYYGTSVAGTNVYAGLGSLYLNISFLCSAGAAGIDDASVVLDPDGLGIGIDVMKDTFLKTNDLHDLVTIDTEKSGFVYRGVRGYLTLCLELDWLYYMSDIPVIEVGLSDGASPYVTRTFSDIFTLIRDAGLSDTAEISRNGSPLPTDHEWVRSGDVLTFSSIVVGYDGPDGKVLPAGLVEAVLSIDGTEKVSKACDPLGWSLNGTVPGTSPAIFSIGLRSVPGLVPDGYPLDELPLLGTDRTFNMKVDLGAPEPPAKVVLYSGDGSVSSFDPDGNFGASWDSVPGQAMDPDGSGVKAFLLEVEGSVPVLVKERGGLFGSYYNGLSYSDLEFERTDADLDFTYSEWGLFGPEESSILPYDFSIRWHGWFYADATRPYRFSMNGVGVAKVLLGNSILFDWTDVSTVPISSQRSISAGDTLPLTIYFKQMGDGSAFTFSMEDERAVLRPVPSMNLMFPSNRTSFKVEGDAAYDVKVRSMDWTDFESATSNATAYVDGGTPRFDLSKVLPWYADVSPSVEVTFSDPAISGFDGSGIDASSISYRLKERSETKFSDWLTTGVSTTVVTEGPEGPLVVRSGTKLDLDANWSGSVQWKVSDLAGNEAQSSVVTLGVDVTPPSFEVLAPNLGIVQKAGNLEFLIKASDRSGSGAVSESVKLRITKEGGTSSGWMTLNGTGSGEEVILTGVFSLAEGSYKLLMTGVDLVDNFGTSSELSLEVEEAVIDLPPVPVISSPEDGSNLTWGRKAVLDASGTEDDGVGPDPLKYTWFSNLDGYLGSGRVIEVYLTLGEHRIKLYVDDGAAGHNVSVSITVNVVKPDIMDDDDDNITTPDNPTLLYLLVISIVAIIIISIIVVFIIIRYKKRKEEEIRLEYIEKTQDDRSYQERILKEEKDMGIDMSPEKKTPEELEEERQKLYGDV